MFRKRSEPEIVLVLSYPLAEQFHACKSYKMRASILSCSENFEENINHIHLAVSNPKITNLTNYNCTKKIFFLLSVNKEIETVLMKINSKGQIHI